MLSIIGAELYILSAVRKNSWGKKSQSCTAECSRMRITHVQSKKEREKNHISEAWQSAPCYFPKTLPKHFDVFFCMHTHSSHPLKGHNLKNRPKALQLSLQQSKIWVWGRWLSGKQGRGCSESQGDCSSSVFCGSQFTIKVISRHCCLVRGPRSK